jgi:hypothetical protein
VTCLPSSIRAAIIKSRNSTRCLIAWSAWFAYRPVSGEEGFAISARA